MWKGRAKGLYPYLNLRLYLPNPRIKITMKIKISDNRLRSAVLSCLVLVFERLTEAALGATTLGTAVEFA